MTHEKGYDQFYPHSCQAGINQPIPRVFTYAKESIFDPLFNNSLLIVVPSQEMAIWSKRETHSIEAIGLILETGLRMYASAIKKHNIFKKVSIISSDSKTIDRTLFDYTMYIDGLVPRTC